MSSKVARGTVTCDNTTMYLLKANDFVAESIRNKIGDQLKMRILVGDLETERDADRLRSVGVDALQIVAHIPAT